MAQDLVISGATTRPIDPVLLGSCMDMLERWLKKYRRDMDTAMRAQAIVLLYEQIVEDREKGKAVEHTLDWLSDMFSAPISRR